MTARSEIERRVKHQQRRVLLDELWQITIVPAALLLPPALLSLPLLLFLAA